MWISRKEDGDFVSVGRRKFLDGSFNLLEPKRLLDGCRAKTAQCLGFEKNGFFVLFCLSGVSTLRGVFRGESVCILCVQ